jgi:hypothetical protein
MGPGTFSVDLKTSVIDLALADEDAGVLDDHRAARRYEIAPDTVVALAIAADQRVARWLKPQDTPKQASQPFHLWAS